MIQPGLRILARIIAREVVNEQLAEMDGLKPDPPSTDATPVEVGEHLEGAAQR